ncbi:hypothetical protein PR202_ga29480 [Eleusine coracana subsp. coracana]|uniref:GDSL esterase/lipase n=1 Tax=Eleusine coracana subsp. coracana TaxID=191504 RepID=A0AAV5DLG5_ELECO|nr:hypothetical protein PR202_ga29480 [Eleusine coracana subsp. coracana]
MKKLLLAVVCVVLLLNAGHVECRRHGGASTTKQYKLFVFGDSFADNGNYPLADLAEDTRAWYYPYGSSDYDHGASASGRFSDGMVQSDFLAGHVECRRHGGASTTKQYKLFVFGDSFADNGKLPLADLAEDTRAWYYPYGSSDYDHGASASGRFSDGMVQSDFLGT